MPGAADTGAATMAKLDNSVMDNTIPNILAILVFIDFLNILLYYLHISTKAYMTFCHLLLNLWRQGISIVRFLSVFTQSPCGLYP